MKQQLKKVMVALDTLLDENLLSEKVATKILTDYVEKLHREKTEERERLANQ